MALAEVADIEAVLGRSLTTDEASRADTLLELASGVVQAYTGQTLEQVVDDEVTIRLFDGTWRLPQRPVTDVSAVAINGTAMDIDSLQWFADGTFGPIWRYWPPYGPTGRESEATVTYTHGYENVPSGVRLVCAQVACGLMASGGTGTGIVQSETLGAYSVTFAVAPDSVSGLSAQQTRILAPYRRRITSVPILAERKGHSWPA